MYGGPLNGGQEIKDNIAPFTITFTIVNKVEHISDAIIIDNNVIEMAGFEMELGSLFCREL
jgi:hypothetical protein